MEGWLEESLEAPSIELLHPQCAEWTWLKSCSHLCWNRLLSKVGTKIAALSTLERSQRNHTLYRWEAKLWLLILSANIACRMPGTWLSAWRTETKKAESLGTGPVFSSASVRDLVTEVNNCHTMRGPREDYTRFFPAMWVVGDEEEREGDFWAES